MARPLPRQDLIRPALSYRVRNFTIRPAEHGHLQVALTPQGRRHTASFLSNGNGARCRRIRFSDHQHKHGTVQWTYTYSDTFSNANTLPYTYPYFYSERHSNTYCFTKSNTETASDSAPASYTAVTLIPRLATVCRRGNRRRAIRDSVHRHPEQTIALPGFASRQSKQRFCSVAARKKTFVIFVCFCYKRNAQANRVKTHRQEGYL